MQTKVKSHWRVRRIINLLVVFALVLTGTLSSLRGAASVMGAPQAPLANDLRISQVYGGGGGSYTHDYIELFNAGTIAISLNNLSIQYASATGTGNFGATNTQLTELPAVTLEPGKYFLVQQASGTGGIALPTPDYTDPTPISLSASNGKVALVNGTTSLGCNGGSTPCPADAIARIIDLIGYGNANYYEGSGAAPALSNTTAALRANGGCTDTDNNAADFTVGAPTPRNTASPTHLCGVDTPALAIVKDAVPAACVAVGDLVTYTIVLANNGTISDTNVTLTDALPSAVDFAYWIEEPAGAVMSADELTWNGAVASDTSITFTFAVTHLVGINMTVVNTAEFSGTLQTGSDSATYATLFTPPYSQGFDTCPAAEWLIYSVASNRDWVCGSGYMEANGFGGNEASNDWLISPAFDFTQTGLETLTFDTWTRYADSGAPWPQLSVKYSTDYNGSGVPTLATWTDLTGATFSPANSEQWTSSGEVDVSGIDSAQVYFAFQYVSSGTGSNSTSSWRVDNFMMYERSPLSIAKTADPPLAIEGEVITYTISLMNIGDVSISDVYFTDTLPSEVNFAYWIEQPEDAAEDDDEITWNGIMPSQDSLTFTFAVTNLVNSGTVVNTAEFSSAEQSGTAEASFTTIDVSKIHTIQGDSLTSPLLGQTHTIEGIVVGDFQPATESIRGFFVQEEDTDTDDNLLTSEGIFVYHNATDVSVGDLVRVSGTVQEYYDMTQLGNVTDVSIVSGDNALPTAASLTLPFSETTYLERYEGMLVSMPQSLYVTEIYNLGRGGQLLLSADARLMNPTQVITPGQPAIDLQATINLNKIILDDGSLRQNPDPVIYPSPFLSATNTVRGGDTVANIVGVLSYSYSGWSGTDAYRIHPIEMPTITHTNPRPTEPPDVGGMLHIASFNVLNYFDTFTGCTAGVGGASTDCRGANNLEEFNRQRDKIINAMLMINADVFGLMEIENDGYADEASAIDDLVDGLNAIAGAGTYAYVDVDTRTGDVNVLGTDAIKVGLLYKPATVILTGTTAVLDSSVDPTFLGGNRPALAQSFEDPITGKVFTVIVNHLKSKGSACTGDPDTGDGQGNCNLTRTAAAEALVDWLDGDPTEVGSDHYLIIGDLNSYAKEDPIVALEDGGYTNLMAHMAGDAADEVYGYVFDGQWGTLDYAMGSHSVLPYVTNAAAWHINADEPIVLDYNVEYKTPGQISSLYNDAPYRASDHDPVIVGLNLTPMEQLTLTKTVTPNANVFPGDEVTYTLTLHNDGALPVNGIALTDTLPWQVYFVDWVNQSSAAENAGVITWNGELEGNETLTISFRAIVRSDSFFLAQPVVNTATYTVFGMPGEAASATFILGGVAAPTLTKAVATPATVLPGDTVTYTLVLYNPVGVTGGVILTDVLPIAMDFSGWVMQNGATVANDIITWSGDLGADETLTIIFNATLHTGTALFNQTITNSATFTADNAGPGSDEASFAVGQVWRIFLPLTMRNS